jgi:hypothetical protein
VFHLLFFIYAVTFLLPVHALLILYEDKAFHLNSLWWHHVVMALLSIVSYAVPVALIIYIGYFLLMCFHDYRSEISRIRLNLCFIIVFFQIFLLMAIISTSAWYVISYIVHYNMLRDKIVIGILSFSMFVFWARIFNYLFIHYGKLIPVKFYLIPAYY